VTPAGTPGSPTVVVVLLDTPAQCREWQGRADLLGGRHRLGPVRHFDVRDRRVTVAATMSGSPNLRVELARVITEACASAGLAGPDCVETGLLFAVHGGDPDAADSSPDAFAADIAATCGLAPTVRAYPSACVAASTAVADAAAMVTLGHCERVIVAAGYLVDPDQFALFDAGRATAWPPSWSSRPAPLGGVTRRCRHV
jgi:3-oxoacyl-[acyl-carrier-protein] synthase II